MQLHKSVSNLDVPHRAVMGDVWEMPFFRHNKVRIARGVLGGWL